MREIRFVQYLRPNGRQADIYIKRLDDVAANADRIVKAGYRLE
jgi:hypothetical protein